MSSRFITLEGGEGVGKSTQAQLLADALERRRVATLLTREPGGSDGAETIRRLLLEGEAGRWGAGAEALLFAAARADHIAKTIRPALASGRWVLCDRFIDSSRAYQGVAGGVGDEAILALHRTGSDGLMPDRTLILTLPEATAAARAERRDGGRADRIGGRDAAYHARVAAAFVAIAEAEPQRCGLIDAEGEAPAVTERLLEALGDLLP